MEIIFSWINFKKENMISSGGETGNFIEKHEIFVNGVIIKEKEKSVSEMNYLLMEKSIK